LLHSQIVHSQTVTQPKVTAIATIDPIYHVPLMMNPALQPNHLLIVEDDRGIQEIILDGPVYSIGREKGCDIRLSSQFVSRRHATLMQGVDKNGSQYYRIVDGNLDGRPSANGLLVNGRKLQAHNLRHQDRIVFGPQVQAIYFFIQREAVPTIPPDEFDITLISPSMVGEPEDREISQVNFVSY